MKLFKILTNNRSSQPVVLLGKGVLKLCRRFTEVNSCRSALQLYWNCISACVFFCNLLHIFRTSFLKNTSGRLLLQQDFLRRNSWGEIPGNILLIYYKLLKQLINNLLRIIRFPFQQTPVGKQTGEAKRKRE